MLKVAYKVDKTNSLGGRIEDFKLIQFGMEIVGKFVFQFRI